MITSQRGVSLIKEFEGLKLKAYLCPAGVWSIGYGHMSGVKPCDTMTPAQAEYLLKSDLVAFERDVNRLVKVPLTQGQFDALISFTYNLGVRKLSTATLLRKINARDYQGAACEFAKWVYTTENGKEVVSTGLIRRREAERKLFES